MADRQAVYITAGTRSTARVSITPTASGFEVDTETTDAGVTQRRHVDVFRTRPLAVAAVKAEAAKLAAAFLGATPTPPGS